MTDKYSDENNPVQYGLGEEDYYSVVDANIERRRAARENRKQEKRKALRKPLLILLAIVLAIGAVIFSFSNFFVVDSIEVEGNSYFTAEEIINMAHASPGKNLLYHPGKSGIKEHLKQNTYIDEVKVKRRLPSTLVIEVKERKQLGAITYDDEYLIVDENGILLRKTQTKPKITLIQGIKISKIKLGEVVESEDEKLLEQTFDLLRGMEENDLYFVRFDMSKNKIRAYVFDYLVCKGTYEQLIDGIDSGRLHTILQTLFKKRIKRGTITFSDDGYTSFEPNI